MEIIILADSCRVHSFLFLKLFLRITPALAFGLQTQSFPRFLFSCDVS